MCQTCHLAIDRPGFEDEPQPFRTHPRLDLVLGAGSPHPLGDVGCTICHRGAGEALAFGRVDHRPADDAAAARWKDEHGWTKEEHWEHPMLRATHVEASCVPCHLDSLELIAAEAPEVAAGYQAFARHGCYACHAVEWFPVTRRPGPSLVPLARKTTREFVATWIAAPRAFRPTTTMPHVFHIENFAADEVIAVADAGDGAPITGAQWNDAAVAAAAAFVWSRSSSEPLPALPVAGDAVRGRETFRLTGCLACHDTSPFAAALARPPAPKDHGPNLRGVARKVRPEWIFAWLRDPAALSPEARMPDLRLTEQEAADIVAYLVEDPEGIFHDTPEGWEATPPAADRAALEELARRHFDRVPPPELARRFAAEWREDEALLEAVGEKVVLHQGCFSCHEIPGLENEAPIGPELTRWGSKPVDQLLWGRIPELLAAAKGLGEKDAHQWRREYTSYRDHYAAQKLAAPRSFDRATIKAPLERLRMPWFDLSDEEIDPLVTFVLGLVNDEVARARMAPTPAQFQRDVGRRILRDKNCAACHLLEPGRIAFTDADGVRHSVAGQFAPFEGDILPPRVGDFAAEAARYEEYVRDEEGDPAFTLADMPILLRRNEPGVGRAGDTVVIEDVASITTTPAWGGDFVDVVAAYYLFPFGVDPDTGEEVSRTADPEGEGRVLDADGEFRNYEAEPYERIRWAFAPPELTNEGAKLQRDWLYQFLLDPVPIRRQLRVRMPSFGWAPGEAGAVADYFAQQAAAEWPGHAVRELLRHVDADPAGLAAAMARAGVRGGSEERIRRLLEGAAPSDGMLLPGLLRYGDTVGFAPAPRPDPAHQVIPQRQPSHLETVLGAEPTFYSKVEQLAWNGPDCRRCHFLRGAAPTAEGPVAWAPDLDLVRDALRPDWVRQWITNPPRTYPGTAMPINFPVAVPEWQDLRPKPGPAQVEDVLTWLFNLDRAPRAAGSSPEDAIRDESP